MDRIFPYRSACIPAGPLPPGMVALRCAAVRGVSYLIPSIQSINNKFERSSEKLLIFNLNPSSETVIFFDLLKSIFPC